MSSVFTKGHQDSQGVRAFHHEERLRELGSFSPEKGRLWKHLIEAAQVCMKLLKTKSGSSLWSTEVEWDNRYELKYEKFTLSIRKTVFHMRTLEQKHRLPRETAQFPSLDVFRIQLDKAPRNLVWPQVDTALNRSLEWRPPELLASLNYPMMLPCLQADSSDTSILLPYRFMGYKMAL